MVKSIEDGQTTGSYAITALESALQVLRVVGEHPGLKASQIAGHAGLTKSKVFRILRTLEQSEYVWLDADHAAYLGTAAFVLGKRAEEQYSLVRVARPVLDELAAATQENIHLVVREGNHSLVVDLRMSSHPLRMYARVGRIGPLHAGGTPKVLLAYAPPDVVEAALAAPLDRYTEATVDSAEQLREVLARIRRDRFHVALSDLEDDTFSIAAPIFDHRGEVNAALSIAGPLLRFDAAREAEYVGLVKAAAGRLSRGLGHRG